MNFEKLTMYLDGLKESYGVPGSDIIVTKDHETVYRHQTGFCDYEEKIPTREDNLYRLFSATKVITMTAVMQLIEQGKLGLYDELQKFIPEFGCLYVADEYTFSFPIHWPERSDPCHLAHNSIRIIDLMSMTAGLNYNTTAPELLRVKEESGNQASTQEVVRAMAGMPLLYEPRTRWAYSLAHDVLAAVVEIVSGQKFSEYLDEHIFRLLGVSDLHFGLDAEQQKRLAALYMGKFGTKDIVRDDGEMSDSFKITENYESGGAGLIAGIADYSTVIDALANGGVGRNGARILSEKSIRLFMTNYTTGQMQKDFEESGKDSYGYGLGVRVLIDGSRSKSPLGEFGWDGAAGAYVVIDPIHHVSIFYVQHIMGFPVVYSEIHPAIRDLVYEALQQ
ncbi:serine hydrolase domain-containing protein [Lachnoclostridium sp. Marseille-P6806]|uniref:serine hydrolase domain-containing protein n=1 Tax=Lachnoclostridium sp. Marseille-P6806 TaxID=2364793 RepID=UPI00102FDA00|nr:serine hydrolase domain-containing protein [Lachnoclostridium sp. Marseille-P6806]